MLYGSIKSENTLKEKGYFLYDSGISYRDEAERIARDHREQGYYAQAVEYSTNIRGLHKFAVWIKRKGG